jgi:hypothetical protein
MTEIQILKPEIKGALKKMPFLRAELMDFNKIGDWTLDQWRLKNNPLLTTIDNLRIIRKFLKLDETVALTETMQIDENGKLSPVGVKEKVVSHS